jgi:hypothetical protein
MDGASLATIGGPGAVLQVSQDAVDEFQVATVNFEVATGQTSTAALNIVTRAGGNRFHGTGFAFYRDDELAAYPGLVRDASNPDPFFRRVQAGISLGGPIRTDRIFVFGSYERSDQDGVVAVWPGAPEFEGLGGIFPSRLSGNLLTVRVDAQLHASHHVLFRHSHDDNEAFAPIGINPLLPSAWSRISNRVDQSLGAVTSTLSERMVNDARVSVLFMDTPESPAGPEDCAGCFGLGSPRTMVQGAGLTFGRSREGRQTGWRAQVTDDLSWQAGRHQLRLGGNWEHASYTTTVINNEPANLTLWTPLQARRFPAIPLPASFTSVEAVHQLPLRSFQTAIGSDENLQEGFRNSRSFDVIRLYAGDVWRVSPRVTVSGGLSWMYEPNVLNHDLTKPALLAPILGPDQLGPPPVPRGIFLPMLGGTWLAASDGKTLVRGGVGRYSDGTSWANSIHLFNERRYLMPLGNGRFNVSGANFLCDGQVLNFQSSPTTYTAQRLLAVLDACRRDLEGALNSGNRDFSIRNLNRAKEGMNLSDPDYGTPSAIHAALGVKRELPFGMAASADVVYKRYSHTFLNGIDYNHFYRAAGPVIPACSAGQRTDDRALCSNGPIYFDTTAGRARYRGLLVRVEKRLSAGAQFLVSYALGSYRGTNGSDDGTAEVTGGRATGFNNDDWFENDGPLPSDLRHVLNISGVVMAPWRVEVSYNVSAYSRPPFSPYVAGFDFNHDGTSDDLLPGTRVNQFGRELDRDDLVRLVDAYNRDYANRMFSVGGTALPIQLPDSFEFNDGSAGRPELQPGIKGLAACGICRDFQPVQHAELHDLRQQLVRPGDVRSAKRGVQPGLRIRWSESGAARRPIGFLIFTAPACPRQSVA